MTTSLDSLVTKEANAVLTHCETSLENGTVLPDSFQSCQVRELTGEAFKWIAEKARNETQWKQKMVPVNNDIGAPIWVKAEYRAKALSRGLMVFDD